MFCAICYYYHCFYRKQRFVYYFFSYLLASSSNVYNSYVLKFGVEMEANRMEKLCQKLWIEYFIGDEGDLSVIQTVCRNIDFVLLPLCDHFDWIEMWMNINKSKQSIEIKRTHCDLWCTTILRFQLPNAPKTIEFPWTDRNFVKEERKKKDSIFKWKETKIKYSLEEITQLGIMWTQPNVTDTWAN